MHLYLACVGKLPRRKIDGAIGAKMRRNSKNRPAFNSQLPAQQCREQIKVKPHRPEQKELLAAKHGFTPLAYRQITTQSTAARQRPAETCQESRVGARFEAR